MPAAFLVSERITEEDGAASALDVSGFGPQVLLTLGIEHVIEQQALEVAIQGSADGATWHPGSLLELPQKFYTGIWSVLIDLSRFPDVRFLRAQWKVNRWGRASKVPSFRWYLFAESLTGD